MKASIKKQFVPYEIAKAMSELGFSEVCIAGYYDLNHTLILADSIEEKVLKTRGYYSLKYMAPTIQQALDWFHTKYRLFSEIKIDVVVTEGQLYSYRIVRPGLKPDEQPLHCYKFLKPNDARVACLQELLLIVKES